MVEFAHELEQCFEPYPQVVGVRRLHAVGFDEALLKDRDHGVAFAFLSGLDDASEPLPVIIERHPGSSRRPTPAASPGLGRPPYDAPLLAVFERETDRAVTQPERVLKLSIRDRTTVDEHVSLNRGR